VAVVQYAFTHKQYTEQHNEANAYKANESVVKCSEVYLGEI